MSLWPVVKSRCFSRLDVAEMNLRLHSIMFVPNFIMFTSVSFHKNDLDLFFFCVAQTLSVTIIVIIAPKQRERLGRLL